MELPREREEVEDTEEATANHHHPHPESGFIDDNDDGEHTAPATSTDGRRRGRGASRSSLHNNNSDRKIGMEACRIYWTSYKAIELSFCLLLFVAAFLWGSLGFKPRQRSIPYQLIEEFTGDGESSSSIYILNQIYDQPLDGEIVSVEALFLFATLLPFLCQLILDYFSPTGFNPHRTCCVYLAGLGLTVLLTDVIKAYVGYLRPIFYDVCVPDDQYQTCTTGEDSNEARQSFPSGHSSLSFCGLGLFSCYLEQRFGVSKFRATSRHPSFVPPSEPDDEEEDDEHHGHGHDQSLYHCRNIALARILSILSKSPLLLAGFIATSRIVDNHHFPADVVGGSVLGFSIALWIHNIWNEKL